MLSKIRIFVFYLTENLNLVKRDFLMAEDEAVIFDNIESEYIEKLEEDHLSRDG